MKPRNSLQLARWLLLGVTLMIAYGSLYPFEFTAAAHPAGGGLAGVLARLTWARTTPSDVAANVLLYLPLGACLGWLLASRLGGPLAVLLGTAGGTLLSLAIEMAQVFEPHRVASLGDLASNGAGALVGALLAVALRSARHGFARHPFSRPLAEPIASALVLLWAGFRLAPFAATLRLAEWRASLRPLAEGPWLAPGETLRYLVPWLVVAEALRTVSRTPRPAVALAAVALAVQAGLVVVVGRSVVPAEVVAVALAVALTWPLAQLDDRRRAALLAALLAVLVVVEGLAPFDFRMDPGAFGLVPFRHALTRYRATNLVDIFGKCFEYGALVWLLARAGLRRPGATLAAAGLVLVIELAQAWLPGKPAEITDPLLVLVAGGLVAVFDSDPRPLRRAQFRA